MWGRKQMIGHAIGLGHVQWESNPRTAVSATTDRSSARRIAFVFPTDSVTAIRLAGGGSKLGIDMSGGQTRELQGLRRSL